MTGSIVFNRQHSSTAGSNLRSELVRPKLRRYSSAGCHGSFESTTDETFEKKCLDKCDPTSSDNDSGIEDFDQQLISVTVETMNDKQKEDIDECEPIFTAGKNEVLEAHSPQTTIQSNEVAENFDENILLRDLERAAKIKHEEKKEFCRDTSIVFHGEFARLISMPISLMCPGINYHLIPEEGLYLDPQYLSNCAWIEIGNAKAQFKCLNPNCYRLWTSMRARIVFKISYPSECAFVFFKIFGQLCEVCESPAESLWYMEEVCRVMENFKNSMFNILFGIPNPTEHNQSIETPIRNHWKPRHDSSQRKGNMRTPHRASHCEACLSGCCYPRNN